MYRTCRFAKSEQRFDEACAAILSRTTRDEASDSDNDSNDDDDVDKIARPLNVDKRAASYATTNKDTSTRWLKALRYLENH